MPGKTIGQEAIADTFHYERQVAALNEPSVRSRGFNVAAINGAVQLSGFVTTPADIDMAVEVAWRVKAGKSLKLDMRGN